MKEKKRKLPNSMTEEDFVSLPKRCQRLYELRSQNNFSQKDIADKISVTVKTYRTWEIGEYKNGNKFFPELSSDVLIKLADIFGVSCDYLLGKTDITKIDNFFINEATGLSENAIQQLQFFDKEEIFVVNKLINHPLFSEFIRKIQNFLHSVNMGICVPNAIDEPFAEKQDNDVAYVDGGLQVNDQKALHKFIINDTLNHILEELFEPYSKKGTELFCDNCVKYIFVYALDCYEYGKDELLIYEIKENFEIIANENPSHPILQYSIEEIISQPYEIWKKIYKTEPPKSIDEIDIDYDYAYYSLLD